MNQHTESRWPTRDTKLAAALLVSGFELCKFDPLTAVIEAQGRNPVITFWFKPSKTDGMMAADMANGWTFGGTPWLDWMKKALEKRDWLIKDVIPGRRKGNTGVAGNAYKTNDLHCAAICCAQDVFLYEYKDRAFYFAERAAQVDRERKMTAGELAKNKLATKQTNWMNLALKQQDQLMKAVHCNLRDATQISVQNERGDTALLSASAPAQVRRNILSELIKTGNRP